MLSPPYSGTRSLYQWSPFSITVSKVSVSMSMVPVSTQRHAGSRLSQHHHYPWFSVLPTLLSTLNFSSSGLGFPLLSFQSHITLPFLAMLPLFLRPLSCPPLSLSLFPHSLSLSLKPLPCSPSTPAPIFTTKSNFLAMFQRSLLLSLLWTLPNASSCFSPSYPQTFPSAIPWSRHVIIRSCGSNSSPQFYLDTYHPTLEEINNTSLAK